MLEQFKIDLRSLGEGRTSLRLALDDSFFEAVKAPVVHSGRLSCEVAIDRKGDVFDLDFHTEGTVTIPCDRCLDDMEQPIVSDYHLVAKFGENYSEDDDLITVPENEGILDTSWFIYQFIELAIPLQACACTWKMQPCHDEAPGRAFGRPKRCR